MPITCLNSQHESNAKNLRTPFLLSAQLRNRNDFGFWIKNIEAYSVPV